MTYRYALRMFFVAVGMTVAAHAVAQTLVSPAGGEQWKIGSKHKVVWSGIDASVGVGADLSVDGGNTWLGMFSLIAGNRDSFPGNWNPGKDSTYDNCFVRLTQQDQNGQKTEITRNSSPFVLYSNAGVKFSVTTPQAGSTIHQDSTVTISWTTSNTTVYSPDTVEVTAYFFPSFDTLSSASKRVIATGLDKSTQSIQWLVPRKPTPYMKFTVNTTDNRASTTVGWVHVAGAAIAFTHPLAQDTMYVGEIDTIKWTVSERYDGKARLEFSSTGGAAQRWDTLATLPNGTTSYAWNPSRTTLVGVLRLWIDSDFVMMRSPQFTIRTRDAVIEAPTSIMTIGDAYPNPFSLARDNGHTVIPVSLAHDARIGVTVYDALGRAVLVRPEEHLAGGAHDLAIDASALRPGVYFTSIRVNGIAYPERSRLVFMR